MSGDLAAALLRAIDWDFVELFPGDDDDPGYDSRAVFCRRVAAALSADEATR